MHRKPKDKNAGERFSREDIGQPTTRGRLLMIDRGRVVVIHRVKVFESVPGAGPSHE